MAAEIVVLNEIIDASIDEELPLDCEEDGEFHLISANAAFMKRDLKRIVGFREVVVPSYAIDEFRSHFRSTKTTFQLLAQELAARMHWKTGLFTSYRKIRKFRLGCKWQDCFDLSERKFSKINGSS